MAKSEFRRARKTVDVSPGESVRIVRELQELSYTEIAEVLQLSIGTVESRLHRARARLKRRLESHARTE